MAIGNALADAELVLERGLGLFLRAEAGVDGSTHGLAALNSEHHKYSGSNREGKNNAPIGSLSFAQGTDPHGQVPGQGS